VEEVEEVEVNMTVDVDNVEVTAAERELVSPDSLLRRDLSL